MDLEMSSRKKDILVFTILLVVMQVVAVITAFLLDKNVIVPILGALVGSILVFFFVYKRNQRKS